MIESFARFSRRAVHGLALSVREPAAGWLVIRMLAWRATLPVMQRVVPLPTLVRLMGCHLRVRDRDGQAQRIVELAGRVFDAPNSGQNCLGRSMVTYRYLSKTSVEPQLVIAFRKGAAPVLGHAWVTVDATPVHDSPEALDEFEPLVVFSSAHGRSTHPTRQHRSLMSSRGAFRFHTRPRAVDTAGNPAVATVARTLLLDGLAAECVSSLRANGIRALLLKGPVTSRWLYAGPRFRPYDDVDLLVAGADFQEASRVLFELGFCDAQAGRSENEITTHANPFVLERPPLGARFPAGLAVDLHVSFHGIQASNSAFWAMAAEGAERIRIAGTDIEVPGEPIRTLLVPLHAATSGPLDAQALADLDHALERVSDETWSASYALAEGLDAVPRFVAGLTMRPLGRELIDRLCIDARIDMESALYFLGSWTGAGGIERLRTTPGFRRRVRLLARELVPTRSFIRYWSPFPRLGVLGLPLGYCYRLFWLALKLPAALRDYVRARRVASRGRAAEPARE